MENQVKEDKNTSIKNHLLVLPYKGEKGIHIVNSMKRYVKKILPENTNVKTAYIEVALLKQKIKQSLSNNTIYARWSILYKTVWKAILNCQQDVLIERGKDHGGRYTQLHALKHK